MQIEKIKIGNICIKMKTFVVNNVTAISLFKNNEIFFSYEELENKNNHVRIDFVIYIGNIQAV